MKILALSCVRINFYSEKTPKLHIILVPYLSPSSRNGYNRDNYSPTCPDIRHAVWREVTNCDTCQCTKQSNKNMVNYQLG